MRQLLMRTIALALLGLNIQVFCLNIQVFYVYRALRTLVELQRAAPAPPAETGAPAP